MAFSVHERHTSHKPIFHSQTHTRKYGFKLFKQFAICLTFGYFLMVLFILQRFFSLLVFVIVVFVVFFACYFCHIPFHFHSNSFSAIFWHSAKYILLISFEENVSLMKTTVFSEYDVIVNCFHENKRFSRPKMQFQQNKLLSVSNSNFISTSYNMIALELKCCVDWTLENKIEIDFYCRPKLRTNLQIFFRAEKNCWTALNNGPFSDDTQIFEQREK